MRDALNDFDIVPGRVDVRREYNPAVGSSINRET
jgi:hypothetical protein